MTKPVSTSKNPRKQHTPEFRNKALKLAERIGVAARELSLYEPRFYAWRSKINNARSGWYSWRLRHHHYDGENTPDRDCGGRG